MSDAGHKNKYAKEQPEAYRHDPPAMETPLIEERYEIIDGIRYDCQPSPTLKHQLLVTSLWHALHNTCHATGTIVVAPMDVHLDESNIVQPDLIYVSNENSHIRAFRCRRILDRGYAS